MFVASVTTVIFNANPLLRYDGYYILSDLLEIPNLRQKSTEYSLGLIKRHIFRLKLPKPLPPLGSAFWLLLYAIASSIYRVFIGIMIIVLVYRPGAGPRRADGPGRRHHLGGRADRIKLVKYLALDPELHRKRKRRHVVQRRRGGGRRRCCCSRCDFPCTSNLPAWCSRTTPSMLRASRKRRAEIRRPGPGHCTSSPHDGQIVNAGQPILQLDDPESVSDLAVRRRQGPGNPGEDSPIDASKTRASWRRTPPI